MPLFAILLLLLASCGCAKAAESPLSLNGAARSSAEQPPAAEKYDPARFDQYGGDLAHPCKGNGYFHLYKDEAAKQWFFCTPDNHRFWMIAVQVFTSYSREVDAKYKGGLNGFYSVMATRLQRLGFNTIGELSNLRAFPITTEGQTDGGNPVKMPFIYHLNVTHYAYQGEAGWGKCPDPTFDIVDGTSEIYKGWRSEFPDVFSNNWSCAVRQSFANNHNIVGGLAVLNKNRWCIGIQVDDSDSLQGFKMGPEGGSPSIHTGWMAGISPPYRRYSKLHGSVFANDPANHTKEAWKQFLQTKYGMIATLNAYWGSNYTGWDSSARQAPRELIAKGNGRTVSFTTTLQHSPVDVNSLGLYIDGIPVGGDCPWVTNNGGCNQGTPVGSGILAGNKSANLAGGSIRYASGELTVQFAAPPPPGVIVSVEYRYGGWPKQYSGGQGLMDEDGSSRWWPADDTLTTIKGAVAQDLDEFLSKIAGRYFEVLDESRAAYLRNHLLIGPDAMNVFTRKRILREAGKHVDLLLVASGEPVPARIAGAKAAYETAGVPIYAYMVSIANPDSPFAKNGLDECKRAGWGMNCKTTQDERGRWYKEQIVQWLNNYRGSDGYGFMVGISWWQLTDNTEEQTNFGIISLRDNLYDGVQSRPEPSVDEWGIVRGGERRPYGAFTPWVQQANQCWWNSDPEKCSIKNKP